MKNDNFKKIEVKYMDRLKMFVPIVNRVHGAEHPEFNEVKVQFDNLVEKINKDNYDLKLEFDNLTKITNNYLVPEDTCESYEMVYQMLEELDKVYRSENK